MGVTFKTIRGQEVAMMPRPEYERLVQQAAEAIEDIGTARLVARARRERRRGRGIVIPFAVADRIASGEGPIRALRKWRGMTQSELAAMIGTPQGYLSDIETGKRSAAAMKVKIARALGVPLDLLSD